jgi:hypothetical protein
MNEEVVSGGSRVVRWVADYLCWSLGAVCGLLAGCSGLSAVLLSAARFVWRALRRFEGQPFLVEESTEDTRGSEFEPRTQARNVFVERGHRELEAVLGIVGTRGKRACAPRAQWRAALAWAGYAVDRYLPRPRLGGKTAEEAWQERHEGYDPALRARLYDATCAALERALQALPQSKSTLRARRRAERAAIWETLQAFQLVRRVRGEAVMSGA